MEDLPKVGEVWREVDPRFERLVRVLDVRPGSGRTVLIQTTVRSAAGHWGPAPRSRASWVDIERFNGKRGGYEPTGEQQ